MILPRRKLLLATPALILPHRRVLAQVGQVPFVVQPPPAAPGGVALISHTTIAGSPTGGTSSGINTVGASLFVIASASDSDGAAYTVSDSVSSIYARLTSYSAGGAVATAQFFYAIPGGSSGSTTFTVTSGTSNYITSYIAVFSGTRTSPLPLEAGSPQGNSGTSSPIQPGSVTPLLNGDLIVTSLAQASGTTASINDGFTPTDQLPAVGGSNFGGALAYLIQATAAAINPTWTLTGGTTTQTAATIAVFAHA